MKKPNILMCHRVSNGKKIDEHYYKRNLVIDENKLYDVIEYLYRKGLKPGTINESLHDPKRFHITFDDGYIEHLAIAKELKEKFSFNKNHCTFCINVGNSILRECSGMDLIYNIIKNDGINELLNYLGINIEENVSYVKQRYIKFSPVEIKKLRDFFQECTSDINELFLDVSQIKELSSLFTIASHGISYRDLRYHIDKSKEEICLSKAELKRIIGLNVEIFGYPEGKNDKAVQKAIEKSGYKFGLSINHDEGNNFRIGRYCINRHLKEFMRDING